MKKAQKKSVKKKPAKKKSVKKKPVKKKPVKEVRPKKPNARQKKFCELFATDAEFFGNGVQSYIEAYKIDTTKSGAYQSAASSAKNLLKKAYILSYIDELLTDLALNDAHVDKQLAFLITQNAELGPKLGAIKEYNALKLRIKNKLELTGADGKPIPVTIVDFGKIDDTQ